MAKKKGRSNRESDAPDALTARLLTLWGWFTKNREVAITAGVLVVLAIAAGLYYYNYRQSLHMEAAAELERVQQVVGSQDVESARSELQTYIERFGDTPYAVEARLLLAELHLQEDAPTEAVNVLEPAADGAISDPLALQAAFLLATAYEEAEREEQAEELYLRIADAAELTFQRREALAGAARLRESEGDYAGAADLYRRILDTFDEEGDASAEQRIYQLRLAEMQAAQDET